MKIEPTDEHRWLQKFVGRWSFESECVMGPAEERVHFRGTDTVRSLDGLWIVAELRSDMPGGGEATMIMTVGFDTTRGRFVGSWVASMHDHLWVYDGWLDAGRNELTLEAQGPAPDQPGELRRYRDITEFVSDDQRRFRSVVLGPDGQWRQFMTSTFTRTG